MTTVLWSLGAFGAGTMFGLLIGGLLNMVKTDPGLDWRGRKL